MAPQRLPEGFDLLLWANDSIERVGQDSPVRKTKLVDYVWEAFKLENIKQACSHRPLCQSLLVYRISVEGICFAVGFTHPRKVQDVTPEPISYL